MVEHLRRDWWMPAASHIQVLIAFERGCAAEAQRAEVEVNEPAIFLSNAKSRMVSHSKSLQGTEGEKR